MINAIANVLYLLYEFTKTEHNYNLFSF